MEPTLASYEGPHITMIQAYINEDESVDRNKTIVKKKVAKYVSIGPGHLRFDNLNIRVESMLREKLPLDEKWHKAVKEENTSPDDHFDGKTVEPGELEDMLNSFRSNCVNDRDQDLLFEKILPFPQSFDAFLRIPPNSKTFQLVGDDGLPKLLCQRHDGLKLNGFFLEAVNEPLQVTDDIATLCTETLKKLQQRKAPLREIKGNNLFVSNNEEVYVIRFDCHIPLK